ncbi:MAG: ATP-binding cassette domain-containing protein [Planctomycetota bacterium]
MSDELGLLSQSAPDESAVLAAAPPAARREEPDAAEAVLLLLARLGEEAGLPAGAEELKQAWRSASLEVPEAEPWMLLTAAAGRVGLRVAALELAPADLRDLLQTGAVLARGPAGWRLLLAPIGAGARVYRPEADQEVELDAEGLLAELGLEPGAPLRGAAVQPLAPTAAGQEGGAPPAEPPSPFARLLRLVAGERRDLLTLLVFALVVGLLNLATPVAVEALVNTVAFVGLLQPIIVLALVLAVCLGFAGVVTALEAVVVELMQRRVFVRVASELAYRLPRARREALDGVWPPELVNRFFDVVVVQKVGAKLLLDGVQVLLSAAVGLLVLAFYHPLLLAFDAFLLAALAVIVGLMGRGAVKTAIKESSAKYAVADWLEELVRHPHAFHLEGGRALALDHTETLANAYLERRGAHYRIVLRQLVGALALQVVTSALLLGLGGWLVKVGELTLGQLVASWLIVSAVLAAVAKLGRHLEGVYDLLAAADKLGVVLELPVERASGEALPARRAPAELRLRGVRHPWLRRPLDLVLEPGRALALLGPSGAGKSVALELVQGERALPAGRIELDGVDLRSLRLATVRPQVGLARPGLVIAASVAENVRLGRQLSFADVQAALEEVGLWEAVQALPEGLETRLTSAGAPLSSGQADLLALARVMAARPRLLLVDGLLDGLGEAELERVVRALTAGPRWTLLVATRRAEVARRFPVSFQLQEVSS